ncbi:MAG TPA: hypothetical protein PLV61_02005 [Parvularculaceae bacterium]|nr:hypothetical protein [Parvularculaceae bacterium]
MVSLMLIRELEKALCLDDEAYEEAPIHVGAFCAFVIKADRARLLKLRFSESGARPYQETAAIGYRLKSGNYDEVLKSAFLIDMEQYSGRTYFADGRAARFELDAIALLGIALGIRATGYADCAWFVRLLRQSIPALHSDPRQRSLAIGALALLEGPDELDAADLKVRVIFGPLCGRAATDDELQEAWKSALEGALCGDIIETAVSRGVFDACLSGLSTVSIKQTALTDLIIVLQGVTDSMARWTYEEAPRVRNAQPRKWEIDHEYHVQNLLWTILRPVFPDLVDEEHLPKVGHKSPRYDLGVPSLQTIIEVKFMRRRGQAECSKIIEEVAADRSLYLGPKTDYSKMIVFIWDDCRQTEEYKTLRDGLESLEGIEKVIILSRPARMAREGG